MNAIIVSDLHIGSRYFLYDHFDRFLRNLPQDDDLVLNGDIIENPSQKLVSPHQQILDLIVKESYRRKVVWVRGNHDNGYAMDEPGGIYFRPFYAIGNRLLIMHGDDFDEVMPRSRPFMMAFKFMHRIRVKLGAKPVHVAHYAKKWKLFYGVLRKNVMMNAVRCAKENGYEAITCGHTHYPEDVLFDGVRYINTGSWTESPLFYLSLTKNAMSLEKLSHLE